MSEYIQDFGLFERLASSIDDPYVDRKMEQARDIAELLNETGFSQVERDDFIHELNYDWLYKNRSVTVSGVIWWTSTEQKIPQRCVVNDLQAISNGFMFDPEWVEIENEYIEGKQNPSFALRVNTDGINGEYIYAAMHFDDMYHIEYPFPSPELRHQRFGYHYPRHAEDIDYAVLNSRNTTEMLADVAMAVFFEGNTQDSTDMEALADLQYYIDDTMALDKELPYRFNILGKIGVLKNQDSVTISTLVLPLRRLGVVRNVRMLREDLSEDPNIGVHRYIPYIEMTLYEQERDSYPKRVLVPFISILSAESIRDEE